MRSWISVVILLLCGLAAGASEWVPLTSDTPEAPRVTVLSDSGDETLLRIEVPGYFLDSVDVAGTSHRRILLPKSPRLLRLGDPELPFVSFAVAVPSEGVPSAEIVGEDVRVVRLGPCAPSKGSLSRSTDPGSVPWTFSGAYGRDALYPVSSAEVGEPYILRNLRGAAVSYYPIRYNPASGDLAVSASATLRVRTGGNGGPNTLVRKVPECREWNQLYRAHVVNAGAGGRGEYTPVQDSGALLVITHDAFYDSVLPLVYWKRQRGVPTEIVRLSEVGSSAAEVKAVNAPS